jgi:hypothetical protein
VLCSCSLRHFGLLDRNVNLSDTRLYSCDGGSVYHEVSSTSRYLQAPKGSHDPVCRQVITVRASKRAATEVDTSLSTRQNLKRSVKFLNSQNSIIYSPTLSHVLQLIFNPFLFLLIFLTTQEHIAVAYSRVSIPAGVLNYGFQQRKII